MNNSFVVDILEPHYQAGNYKLFNNKKNTDFGLIESFLIANMVPEIGTSEVVHRQVKVELILEWAMNVDQERVV